MKVLSYLLLSSSLLFFHFTLLAQEESAPKMQEHQYYAIPGSHSFHIGAGFPNKVGLGFTGVELADNFLGTEQIEGGYTTPQFTFRYEYTLDEELGFGLHLGYWEAQTPTFEFGEDLLQPQEGVLGEIVDGFCDLFPNQCTLVEETLEGSKKVTSFSFGGQITYHKRVFPQIDSYASAVLGYNIVREKNAGDPNDKFENLKVPTFVYFTSIGIRYYFSPKFALYGEIGYGNISNFNAGITYRIP